jgi:hypothetical protein
MTRFRMRPDGDAVMDGMSVREFDDKLREYFEYLRPKRAEMPKDLWRFFAEDFFHDGPLEKMKLRLEQRHLRLDLTCPNVKRFSAPDTFDFVNVGFRVVIDDVWSMTLHVVDDDGNRDTFTQFWAAEIDTEEDGIQAASVSRDDVHHSLTIHTSRFWLTVVFGYMSVEPLEPAATNLMLADPRYVFPFAK